MKKRQMNLCLGLVLAIMLVSLTSCRYGNDEPTDYAADIPRAETEAEPTVEPVTEPTAEPAAEPVTAAFSMSEGIDENGFWTNVRALDYVEIFNYQAMRIPEHVHNISDDDLQSEIGQVLSQFLQSNRITDRAVADGDTVNIDFVGSVDGVEFDGGNTMGMGTYVTIGVTAFIDDFLEQLIGSVPGDTVNVEVTFPDFYPQAPHLENQEALFITNINYITEEILPELTDEFVMEHLFGITGWGTVDEMKEDMRSVLRQVAIQHYIHEYFTTQVQVSSVPESLIDYQNRAMIDFYQQHADMFGMELDVFLAMFVGVESIEELIEDNLATLLNDATFSLVVQAVAEDAGLSVTSADLGDYFYEHTGSRDYSMFEEIHGLPFLKNVVLTQIVIDYIASNAVLE